MFCSPVYEAPDRKADLCTRNLPGASTVKRIRFLRKRCSCKWAYAQQRLIFVGMRPEHMPLEQRLLINGRKQFLCQTGKHGARRAIIGAHGGFYELDMGQVGALKQMLNHASPQALSAGLFMHRYPPDKKRVGNRKSAGEGNGCYGR